MFQLQLTKKQIQKIHLHDANENTLKIPEKWADFARLSNIKSEGQVTKFIPWEYQLELIKLLELGSGVVTKSRQIGVSELILSHQLHKCARNEAHTTLIFSQTQGHGHKLARRCLRALNGMGIKLESESQSHLRIKNGGDLAFLPAKEEAPRGFESVGCCIFDEASIGEYGDNLKAIREAASACGAMLGSNFREIFISSPNGTNNYFHHLLEKNSPEDVVDICKKVMNGDYGKPYKGFVNPNNGWFTFYAGYKANPIFAKNENFLQEKHEEGVTWDSLKREYCLDFNTPEAQFFNSISLEACWIENVQEKEAEKGCLYICGLDSNDGGDDHMVLSIWKIKNRTFTKVAGYRKSRGDFDYHLTRILMLLEKFPNAICAVEKNSAGNTYFGQIKMRMPTLKMHLVSVTGENKPTMVTRLKFAIESNKLFWEKSDPLQKDLENFRHNGDKFEAASGKHDDEVSAASVMLAAADLDGLLGGF